MSRFTEPTAAINIEVADVIRRLDERQVDALITAIQTSSRVALFGVGREGLMMRALAMRLYHLGYDVSVVGDMTTPHLGASDLLILSAGPGYFSTVDGLRQVAQRDGARVCCVTAQPTGATPAACDLQVYIPAQTMANDVGSAATSILPMGSLFELAMFYFGELLILEILKQTGKAIGEARDRHTNLE
jgi:6-phospho-3-hexuloisomerase